MEYTKDLILNVNCKDIKHGFLESKKNWTSIVFQKIKRHKIVLGAVTIASVFITIDVILLVNFINVLASL